MPTELWFAPLTIVTPEPLSAARGTAMNVEAASLPMKLPAITLFVAPAPVSSNELNRL